MNIFVYLKDKEELEIIYKIVEENSNINFYIAIESINEDDFFRESLSRKVNANYYLLDKLDFSILSQCGIALTTVKNISCDNLIYQAIVNVFYSIEVPVIYLDYEVEPLSINENNVLSLTKNNANTCDYIGYPLKEQNIYDGEYVLVLSDLYKEYYSSKEVADFHRSVFEYLWQKNNGQANMIWINDKNDLLSEKVTYSLTKFKNAYSSSLGRLKFKNENSMLSDIEISDLIAKAKLIITTSTNSNLLTCEMYNKKVAIYLRDNITDKEKNDFKGCTVFTNEDELENGIFDNECKKISSNFYSPYDNNTFIKYINAKYNNAIELNHNYYHSTLIASMIVTNHDLKLQNQELTDEITQIKGMQTNRNTSSILSVNKKNHNARNYKLVLLHIEKRMIPQWIIKSSKLFDAKWYSNEYGIKKKDAAVHYLKYGYKLGYNPSPIFDGEKYNTIYSDVRNAQINPLLHYEVYGKFENRKYTSTFNS